MESKLITREMMKPLFAYLIVWALSVLSFWLGFKADAMAYSVVVLFMVIPAAIFVCALMVGMNERWGAWTWAICLLLGLTHAIAGYMTFDFCNMVAGGGFSLPELDSVPLMTAVALIGAGVGKGISMLKKRREKAK